MTLSDQLLLDLVTAELRFAALFREIAITAYNRGHVDEERRANRCIQRSLTNASDMAKGVSLLARDASTDAEWECGIIAQIQFALRRSGT